MNTPTAPPGSSRARRRRVIIIAAALLLLLAVLFGPQLYSLHQPSPESAWLLWLISVLSFLGVVVLTLVLGRQVAKLYAERRAHISGSQFKTKLVIGALGLSLLPVVCMFGFTYGLINRTLDKWFSQPVVEVRDDNLHVLDELNDYVQANAQHEAESIARNPDIAAGVLTGDGPRVRQALALHQGTLEGGFALLANANGQTLYALDAPANTRPADATRMVLGKTTYLLTHAPILGGPPGAQVEVGMPIPPEVTAQLAHLSAAAAQYDRYHYAFRQLRLVYTGLLLLLTLAILFGATWMALYLSKLVTVPIAELAAATQEISRGNLGYRVRVSAQDELGALVHSFNRMAAELEANRGQLESSRLQLESFNRELEERRRYTEALLENTPSAVVSLGHEYQIERTNPAVLRLFGVTGAPPRRLEDLFDSASIAELRHLLRKSERWPAATGQLELNANGRQLTVAVTAAAIPSQGSRPRAFSGYVLVLEDLTDLLRIQKTAAWREVAQRIAHEIKNPLTPIALSAQRIRRRLGAAPAPALEVANAAVIAECAATIEAEVHSLERLVNEFSSFARFPRAQPVECDLNEILERALRAFDGRLDGIQIRTQLEELPHLRLDPEDMKRVFINLIDNAAEAMRTSPFRQITLSTRPLEGAVEAVVADTGHGIPAGDKPRLFLPYYSTKARGTGLGLAIVLRIVEENGGTLRVEDNTPLGARFIVELPAEAPAPPPSPGFTGYTNLMPRSKILIVDDEQGIRHSLSGVLGDENYQTRAVGDAAACLRALAEDSFDLILLDVWLPDQDGLDLLTRIQQQPSPPAVIMISGHGSIETAVRATKLGAFDFLEKPLGIEKTLLTIRHALENRQLDRDNRHLRQHFASTAELVGASVPLRALRQQIAIMAPTNGRVLIYGESGAGKELVARALHAQSERRTGLFVEVNCAAIPEELIESELFGHIQGAFAGASEAKEGKFSRADGGTLFLDEIGDMSLKTQAKVLRTLDEGRFEVLGASATATSDARIIAATNKNIEEEIAKGNFREDLFYRLNVIPFYVPPLRERKEDVPLLARHFLLEFANAYGRKCREFAPEALTALQSYPWPGNVRELRNVVERVAILTPNARVIERRHLPPLLLRARRLPEADFATLHDARSAYERDYILKKLEENAGNMTRTAEVLGLERSHLYRKMKSLGMEDKDGGESDTPTN